MKIFAQQARYLHIAVSISLTVVAAVAGRATGWARRHPTAGGTAGATVKRPERE